MPSSSFWKVAAALAVFPLMVVFEISKETLKRGAISGGGGGKVKMIAVSPKEFFELENEVAANLFHAQEILQDLDGNECVREPRWAGYKDFIYQMRLEHQQKMRNVRENMKKYHEMFDIDDEYSEDRLPKSVSDENGEAIDRDYRLGEFELIQQHVFAFKVFIITFGIKKYASSDECRKGLKKLPLHDYEIIYTRLL